MKNELFIAVFVAAFLPAMRAAAVGPVEVGDRRELFIDGWMAESMKGTELRLHEPQPREVAITFDRPWEGNISTYAAVFPDGRRFRMYYRANNYNLQNQTISPEYTCYAESDDAIRWTRPSLHLVEHAGSKDNNIIFHGSHTHNFAPFKDARPGVSAEGRYKAISSGNGGLLPFQSADGFRWTLMSEKPVITDGKFDSQNLAFWDSVRGKYICFFRDFRNGVRDIKVCTSDDFLNWSAPKWLEWGDARAEHLYTNAITPCPRAEHILIGFPMRFVPERKVAEHPIAGMSDGQLMSSRDGLKWHRWQKAFLRPGPQPSRWVNRNNMIAWGVLQTKSDMDGAPDELSLFSTEGYYSGPCRLRRHTLRMDGFVSVHAGATQGEITTRPFVFSGNRLTINYATSAAGSMRLELQTADGQAVPGFTLDEAVEMFGDHLDATVAWKGGSSLAVLAGKQVRIRALMREADWYSFRFE